MVYYVSYKYIYEVRSRLGRKLELLTFLVRPVMIIERLSMTFTANGKRQKMKLLPSVFSSLYSRIKIFVFVVNDKRHFSIFV